MIELSGELQNILRTYQKEVGSVKKSSAKEPSNGRTQKDSDNATQEPLSERVLQPSKAQVDTYSTINFEYVPSGRINLNHEAEQHIIDFFE